MNEKFNVTNAKDKEKAESAVNEAVAARLADLDQALSLELKKLDIKDGDVYVVKMTGDEFDAVTVQNFKKVLKGKFPKVEFVVLALPKDHEIEFQKLGGEKS